MPEIKDGANHKDIIVPDAEVEKLFTNIGIGFGCKVVYIDKNNTSSATTLTGILKSYDMPNRKLVITRQGKDEELDMNYLSEITAYKDADRVPTTRKARQDKLIRLRDYLSYYASESEHRRAQTPKALSEEFTYIARDETNYFYKFDDETIINQLEASEGLSPYRAPKVSTETLERFSRWADGVK
ncbi:hypothetical protein ACEK06_17260 [Pseudomonas brenneri]|uniref:hypothetical protein n=1 Tax=Pseudomonas brenneri TaxID=129817 RepID=UPI003570F276